MIWLVVVGCLAMGCAVGMFLGALFAARNVLRAEARTRILESRLAQLEGEVFEIDLPLGHQ